MITLVQVQILERKYLLEIYKAVQAYQAQHRMQQTKVQMNQIGKAKFNFPCHPEMLLCIYQNISLNARKLKYWSTILSTLSTFWKEKVSFHRPLMGQKTMVLIMIKTNTFVMRMIIQLFDLKQLRDQEKVPLVKYLSALIIKRRNLLLLRYLEIRKDCISKD